MSTEESSGLSRTATIVTIVGTLLGTVLAYLSLAAAVKWPPFTEPSVEVFQGANPQKDNCFRSACHFIGLTLSDFDPDSAVRCTFDSAEGANLFGAEVITTDADGNARVESTNNYGTPGGWVSATCDGHTAKLEGW
ncbi:hypothetical protein [Catellatospora tritici]|uniref:hypothetical protein n=1 Tax=Catellatospora tritici TaxID=2851566 RepID=UPI001C2DD288|nr:hypothetical protein [Catellatospora tritici]MBV1855447.1 hypothetical protein [Catellatospora tritici]